MALEPNKKDRSYQFGRLLAILEKAERDTYDEDEKREPNAIRQQAVFCQHPMYTANTLSQRIKTAYYPRLKPASRGYYDMLTQEILDVISSFPEAEWNRPLGETYLMGYYLQRKSLYTKKDNGGNE